MLAADGTGARVKVLDFGLARALEPHAVDAANSPTVLTATHAGVLLGTAAYMAPEQARGHAADERSDVWALGSVLFEMLAARPPFTGDTLADMLGGIVRVDPDWSALPAATPPALRALIKGCLERDRRRRYHAIGHVRLELEKIQSGAAAGAVSSASPRRERLAWATAAVLGLATASVVAWSIYLAPEPPEPVAARFELDLPADAIVGNAEAAPLPSVSPDGRYVAFLAGRQGGAPGAHVWLRALDALTAQAIAGTAGIVGPDANKYPFWSPDSRFIAFFRGGKLEKVAIDGGPPQTLTESAGVPGVTGTWNRDDVILFEQQGAIHRVSAAGGASTAVRTPDKAQNESAYRFPSFLPDGRHFIYIAVHPETGRTQVRVGNLDSAEDIPLFFTAPTRIVYSLPGVLLFVRAGTLMAQPFDADRLRLSGDLFPVAQQIGQVAAGNLAGIAGFGASSNGTLVYRVGSAGAPTELAWFDRTGRKVGTVPVAGNFINPILSPDQNRVAVERIDGSNRDIWIVDLARGTSSRFTFDPAVEQYPVFSADGQQILFVSDRSGAWDLYSKAANGIGEEKLLLKGANGVTDWSAAA